MIPAPEFERRLVLRVLNRWQDLCGDRPFPSRGEIDPERFGDDWANCFILALDAGPEPLFLYAGTAFAGPDWNDAAGKRIVECPEHTLLRSAATFFQRVLDRRIPMSVGGPGVNFGRAILYRSILLPLSENGERIDALLGAANCRDAVEMPAATEPAADSATAPNSEPPASEETASAA
jgi:hypothetical protein